MPKEFGRSRRIAALVKQELALIIQQQYPVHSFGLITITAVVVSADLKKAVVYLTHLQDTRYSEADPLIERLNGEARFLRGELARSIYVKNVPHIRFEYDTSIAHAAHITTLLDTL